MNIVVEGRPDVVAAMTGRRKLMELRAPAELVGHVAASPLVRRIYPRGDGHRVLVIPGGLTTDNHTMLLRHALRRQGYDARGWGLGRNFSLDDKKLSAIKACVEDFYAAGDAKISVIGWSLGGIVARMIAREPPEKVRHVFTLGTPFRMLATDHISPLGPRLWQRFLAAQSAELDLLSVHEHHRPPLAVPATSIYSPTDGIANWRISLDETGPASGNPRAENVAVRGTHTGLVVNPAVLAILFDRLALPSGQWRPFVPALRMRRWYPTAATWMPQRQEQ